MLAVAKLTRLGLVLWLNWSGSLVSWIFALFIYRRGVKTDLALWTNSSVCGSEDPALPRQQRNQFASPPTSVEERSVIRSCLNDLRNHSPNILGDMMVDNSEPIIVVA